jgi:hypothetical protein
LKYQRSAHGDRDKLAFIHTAIMALLVQAVVSYGIGRLLSLGRDALLRRLLGREKPEPKEDSESEMARAAWGMATDMAGTLSYGGADLVDNIHRLQRLTETRNAWAFNNVSRDNLLSDTMAKMVEVPGQLVMAKDTMDYARTASQALMFWVNVLGAPEYPVRVADAALRIADKEPYADQAKERIRQRDMRIEAARRRRERAISNSQKVIQERRERRERRERAE